MTERVEGEAREWRERPWIMAGVGAVGGLLVHILTDGLTYYPVPTPGTILRQSAAAGIAIATITFLITGEKRRLGWAAGFAVAWGLIMALVGYSTGAYNRGGDLVEFPFLSGLLAIAVASPLFQTLRDEGRRSLPYRQVHRYAWTDAIIGGASLAFTGLTFLLAFLLSALFDAIGIPFLKDLLEEGWFNWPLAGAAFGAASAVLREKDPLLGTLQRLVMLVFSVLAPVLAGALAIYLVALPTTGFAGLWKSGLPETPLLLSTAAFAVVFLNAIIGDSPDDRSGGRLWRVTEGVLLFAVLPLGVLALVSMGIRVGQYGWTPERLWGVIACLVAIAYGAAAWSAGIRGRKAFDVPLREYQKWLAVGLCGLALFLALPLIDFGSISARSQLARLEGGKVAAEDFDWAAMAFDFGPAGREALERMARRGSAEQRSAANAALKSENRYKLTEETIVAGPAPTDLTVVPRDAAVPNDLRAQLLGGPGVKDPFCSTGGACRVYPQQGGSTFVVFMDGCANLPKERQDDPKAECTRSPAIFETRDGKWVDVLPSYFPEPRRPFAKEADAADSLRREREALESGDVRLVPVTRRQLVIGGKRVAGEFE